MEAQSSTMKTDDRFEGVGARTQKGFGGLPQQMEKPPQEHPEAEQAIGAKAIRGRKHPGKAGVTKSTQEVTLDRLNDLVEEIEDDAWTIRYGRFEPIEPRLYSGERDSLAVKAWLRETQYYLEDCGVQRQKWVSVAARFLDGTAMYWYLMAEGKYANLDWEDFKDEMHRCFVPENEQMRLMDKWKSLKQGDGGVSDYVSKYKLLVLRLPHLHDLTKMHGFLFGLEPGLRSDVESPSPQSLELVVSLAERFDCASDMWYDESGEDAYDDGMCHRFFPRSERMWLMDKWRSLEQGRKERLPDYVNKYSQLMVKLPHLHEYTRMHGFVSGLKPRMSFEVEKQLPKTLSEAVRLAFMMDDQELFCQPSRSLPQVRPKKTAKQGKMNQESLGKAASQLKGSIASRGTHSPLVGSRQSGSIPKTGCFDCGGPHFASSCPQKKSASMKLTASQNEIAIAEDEMEQSFQKLGMKDREGEMATDVPIGRSGVARVTSQARSTCIIKPIENMVLKADINGYGCEMLISCGATHNFLTPECAERLQLVTNPLENVSVRFALGSSTVVKHMVMDIMVESGAWKGKVDFLIMPMQRFEAILGMDWADKYLITLFFGRNAGKVLLDNLDGAGGVMVSLHSLCHALIF